MALLGVTNSLPLPGAPVVVPCRAPSIAAVRAVIPSFGREGDLSLLLDDLAAQRLELGGAPIDLDILVVDNASPRPLEAVVAGRARVLRLSSNRGGSGGFNAGMVAHLRAWDTPAEPGHFLWLIDSDARLKPDALRALVEVMIERPACVAAGSALADPQTGEVFETGGRVDRRTGELVQPAPASGVVAVEYVAACSMLVRRGAVERAGVMRDVFLNGDDAEWCLRLARLTGGEIVAVPASVALHPRPDRMRSLARYYAARNAFAVLDAASAPAPARGRRALRETSRAIAQHMVGRDDLAALHMAGLRDASEGVLEGAMASGPALEPARPLSELAQAAATLIRAGASVGVSPEVKSPACLAAIAGIEHRPEAGAGAPTPWASARTARSLLRLVTGPPHDVALVSARARPGDWLAGRTMILLDDAGFHVRTAVGWGVLARAAATGLRGLLLAAQMTMFPPRVAPVRRPRLPARPTQPGAPRLSIVVLSYNRKEALRRTLDELARLEDTRDAEVIVVDNASTDGSAAMVRDEFPRARTLALDVNIGIAGFNRGAELARGAYLLILDDDARPAPGAVRAATARLDAEPSLAGIALHPRHPASGASEWPFAALALAGTLGASRWPVMGCANLVRRDAWLAEGGYDEGFFLYRNDCDLAMRLLNAGYGVAFDPDLVVWHDSPGAGRKSARWFELATRNWMIMCRRHGRGLSGAAAALLGWAWAHRLAGTSLPMHLRALRGAAHGLGAPVHSPAAGASRSTPRPDGRPLADLLALQVRSVLGRTRRRSTPSALPAPVAPAGPAASSRPSSDLHSP